MKTGKEAVARRVAGRIVEWDDQRGFGFVLPNGGDQKRFLHIKAFIHLQRRPGIGDLVAYTPGLDERGRPTALEVKYNVGTSAEEPVGKKKQSTGWRALLGFCVLISTAIAWYRYGLPKLALGTYVLSSAVSLGLYAFDKSAAGTGRQRTSEATLHLWSLAGGWPGALIAQHFFRHKSRKASFQSVFWMSVLLNVSAVVWLNTSDAGRLILSMLMRE